MRSVSEGNLERDRFRYRLALFGLFEHRQRLADATGRNSLASALDELGFDQLFGLSVKAQAAGDCRIDCPQVIHGEPILSWQDDWERWATTTRSSISI
jgi:hypothetical protein